ncbi:MAG: 4-hydroxythreonine-4-phosphate dehydrogenase PdxA [Muribaculaceae bacterium]|nr:4-hydroxythreonine-4-phosphate dehydrogenase PdxA [Muribaculaceae bacterium]
MRIGITHGDFNGVGYEVILKALSDDRMLELFTPVVYGIPALADWYAGKLESEPLSWHTVSSAGSVKNGTYNFVDIYPDGSVPEVHAGESTPEAGKASLMALEMAVEDMKTGIVDALVTAPINKNNIQGEDFKFPGHTEYLEDRLGEGDMKKALMILCAGGLRVALATAHVPLSEVSQAITKELIIEKLEIFNRSLRRDFGVNNPRIAVLSVNPHAGDHGVIGTEDDGVVAPAVDDARQAGIQAFGPYPSDGFFGAGHYRKFDGVLAMYHDQGLIPFKTLSMDEGVNFTAGLPYVRTSPDHGTGYDIAGHGEASEESLRAAIYTAIDIVRNRERYDEACKNPLERSMPERGHRQRDRQQQD